MLDMNEDGGSSTSLSYFVTTIWKMVDDLSSNLTISWSMSGESFIIWNPLKFYRDLLPRYFETNGLEMFFYQLDMHGFRRTDSELWEFANDNFMRGQPHLMENIISHITEKSDQLYQRRVMRKAEDLFRLQVKEVEDELQHTRFKESRTKKHHTSITSCPLFLFLDKAYEMVDDPSTDTIISWSQSGKSFIIWNPQEFYNNFLEKLYETHHISLFFFDLEGYGFRTIDPEKWEFANDNFVQGQPHLVENIRIKDMEDVDQSKELDRETEMRDAKYLFKLQVEEASGLKFGVSNSLPPFLTTTYNMVDDPSLDSIISWSQNNNSFIIWDMVKFERYLLHEFKKLLMKIESFWFGIETYGFERIDPERWEFANKNFIRDQPHLMENIILQKMKEDKEILYKRIEMRKKMRNAAK